MRQVERNKNGGKNKQKQNLATILGRGWVGIIKEIYGGCLVVIIYVYICIY